MADEVDRVLVAGHEQQPQRGVDLRGGQLLSVLLGGYQRRDEVVAGIAAALFDEQGEVVGELLLDAAASACRGPSCLATSVAALILAGSNEQHSWARGQLATNGRSFSGMPISSQITAMGGQPAQAGVVGWIAVQERLIVHLGQIRGGELGLREQGAVRGGVAVVAGNPRMPQYGGDIVVAEQAHRAEQVEHRVVADRVRVGCGGDLAAGQGCVWFGLGGEGARPVVAAQATRVRLNRERVVRAGLAYIDLRGLSRDE